MAEKSYNDKNGNSVAKKQYLYGNDGNIAVTVDFASDSYTRYNYDLSGRTASVREYSGTDLSSNIPISYTEYKYADKTNYLTNVKHFSPLGTQNIAYNYGNINNGQMPDQVYSISWNGVNKLENSFDALSRLTTRKVNGLATNYTYKDIGENQTTTLVKSIETSGITHTYEYDALGNITSIYDGSRTTTYKYDDLNQLVRADNPYENKTHIYTYENGNITEDKVYAYTAGTSEPTNLKYTVKYSYSNEKWADVLTGVEKVYPQNSVNAISLEQEETPEIVTRLLGENAQRYDMKSRLLPNSGISLLSLGDNENYYSVTSDEIGNITSYKGSTYTWVGRQLQSVSNEDYTSIFSYNSDGQRIGKTISVNGDSTYNYEYYYNGDILSGYKLVITKSDGSSTTHNVTFMYDENGEAFGFNYNGNDYYYVRNAQNDVVFITDSDNIGVVLYQYDAWGNITACADVSDGGMVSIVNPYTYRGYFYEIENNSYFLKSRYYNPELCRFISADSLLDNRDINRLNQFAYCANNPIAFVDNTGKLLIGCIVGTVVGATLGAITAAATGKSIVSGALSGAFVGGVSGLICGGIVSAIGMGAAALAACTVANVAVATVGNVMNQYGNYRYNKKKNVIKGTPNNSPKSNQRGKRIKNAAASFKNELNDFKMTIDYKSIGESAVSAAVFTPISFGCGSIVNNCFQTGGKTVLSEMVVEFAINGNLASVQSVIELFSDTE